jgi:hypothetical protein
MFFSAKTIAGRLHLAKKLLNLPVGTLKSFAGTRKGLAMLNSWILVCFFYFTASHPVRNLDHWGFTNYFKILKLLVSFNDDHMQTKKF